MPSYGAWIDPEGKEIDLGQQDHLSVARQICGQFDGTKLLLKRGWLRIVYPKFNNGTLTIEHTDAAVLSPRAVAAAKRLVFVHFPARLLIESERFCVSMLHPAVNLERGNWDGPQAERFRPSPVGAYFGKPEGD